MSMHAKEVVFYLIANVAIGLLEHRYITGDQAIVVLQFGEIARSVL